MGVAEKPHAAGPARASAAAARAGELVRRIAHGGLGVALAVLLPRAASFVAQWLLTLSAGPAAVAAFVTLVSRGTVVVSLVAAGLAPTLMHRRRALASRSGRALAGGALLILAALALAVTLAYELTLGHGGAAGLTSAVFSACSLFASVSVVMWPIWQIEGRYLQSLAVLLAASPVASSLAALAGRPAATCLATGLASATPALLLVRPGRFRVRRAIRYALILVRRSVPLSMSNFATAVVFPAALSAGTAALGGHAVGQQTLYWSCIVALSIASQSFASRALIGAGAEGDPGRGASALRAWLRPALALALAVACLYAVFTVPIPWLRGSGSAREALVPSMLVSGIAPLITDPLCFFFSGRRRQRLLAAGSIGCSAAVGACLALAPATVIRHFGVIGPSAVIGVLRLAFVVEAPARRPARAAAAILLAAYAVALLR